MFNILCNDFYYLERLFSKVLSILIIMESAFQTDFFAAPAIRKVDELKRREEEDFQVCTSRVNITVCRWMFSS